jgi:hypothetical protein
MPNSGVNQRKFLPSQGKREVAGGGKGDGGKRSGKRKLEYLNKL